jgi:predicted RNA binding protein YcfA (HicA-like mRNA interferase family)
VRPLTARKLINILQANGFVQTRQKGSHLIFRNDSSGIMVPVPLHGMSKPIHIGTFRAIVRQSKIPPKFFK